MKKTKVLALILCGMVCLSGCQQIKSIVKTERSIAETVSMITVEPSEDGWTLEQLSNVIYINNQPITIPLTKNNLQKALGNKFSVVNSKPVIKYNNRDAFGVVWIAEDEIGSILFSKESNKSSIEAQDLISVNGVTFNYEPSSVVENMGTPDYEHEYDGILIYNYYINQNDGMVISFEFKDNIMCNIRIDFVAYKN